MAWVIALGFGLAALGLAADVGSPAGLSLDRGKLVAADGQVIALAWAYGLTDAAELPEYHELGFNTLYVDLPFQGGSAPDLERLLTAAQQEGLYLVLGLATLQKVKASGPVRPTDEAYRQEARAWIRSVVEAFRATPGLLGWGVQHEPEGRLQLDDAGFRAFLQRQYEQEPRFRLAWGTPRLSWSEVTCQRAMQLDDDAPGGFARPSLDLSLYQQTASEELHRFWAQTIREVDPDHLLLTGRQAFYRSLPTLPAEYQVIVPALYPNRAEKDDLTHNVHAVDMARRGNRFAAVPTLWSGSSAGEKATPQQLYAWTLAAFVHGAAGVAFSDWSALRDDTPQARAIRQALATARQTGLVAGRSTPTAAILYEPFALGDRSRGKALYGYEAGLVEGEPAGLVPAFRSGTKYGQMDFLAIADVPETDLHRYGTLFAPAAFWIPHAAAQALASFVQKGGRLVADLGFGAYQQRGDLTALAPEFRALFGVEGLDRVQPASELVGPAPDPRVAEALKHLPRPRRSPGDMRFPESHPLFPSIAPRSFTTGRERRGTFTGLYGWMNPGLQAFRFGVITAEQEKGGNRSFLVGLTIHPYGDGYGLFSSVFLWQNWRPGCALYDEFHGDLLRHRATLGVVNCPSLFPAPAEFARHEETLVACHHGPDQPTAVVDLVDLEQWLYPEALNTLGWVSPHPSDGPEAETSPSAGEALFVNRLYFRLPPQGLVVKPPLPIRLTPHGAAVAAEVVAYTEERIELELYGEGFWVGLEPRHGWRVQVPPGASSEVTLTVHAGRYPLAVGSPHQVEVFSLPSGQRREARLVFVGPEGQLTFRGIFHRERVVIQAAGAAAAPHPPGPGRRGTRADPP